MRNTGINIPNARIKIVSEVCSAIYSNRVVNKPANNGTQRNADKINAHTDTLGL